MGAWSRVARAEESRHPGVHRHRPAWRSAGRSELKAFHTGGFLGTEFGPFLIVDPQDAASAVRPPEGLGASALRSRHQLFKKLLAKEPVGQYGSDYQHESLLRSLEAAHRLLTSPAAKAFDLSLEPKKSLRHLQHRPLRPGCLLARRLVEAGARFIEVTTEYIPFRPLGHARERPRPRGA